MNRSVFWVGVAALAFGCNTELQPIGSAGAAGVVGGVGAGVGGIGGVGGGMPPDAGNNMCDDGDPCTIDYGSPEFGCTYEWNSMCGGMAGSAGFAGLGGVGGYAGEAGGGAYGGTGGVGGESCDDGDPCTIDYAMTTIFPFFSCMHEYDPACGMGGVGGYAGEAGGGAYGGGGGIGGIGGVGGYAGEAGGGAYGGSYAGAGGAGGCGEMGFDEDGDGYPNTICGGDCDDNDESAFPYQSSFFTVARSSGGYDYDCDGQVTLRWGELHNGCVLDANGQGCVGSGWTSGDMNMFLPGCGQASEYAFCEFTGTDCAVSMHTVTQACR